MCILVRSELLDNASATAAVGPDDVCLPHTVFHLLSIQGRGLYLPPIPFYCYVHYTFDLPSACSQYMFAMSTWISIIIFHNKKVLLPIFV